MKIKYNKNLEYQTEAINSVVGIFEGGEKFSRRENFSLNSEFEKYALL
jgi:restriction endonuclease